MVRIEQDWDEIDPEDWRLREDEHALSPAGIAEQNDGLLRRYREFRRAADSVVAAWRNHPEVIAVTLGVAAASIVFLLTRIFSDNF